MLLTMLDRYDFEYEDNDDDDSGDVGIENKYYNAKQMKGSDPEEAIEEFLGIPALEPEKGEWGFKGLKQAIKLEYRLGRYDKVSSGWLGRGTPSQFSWLIFTNTGRGALH
jgi:COP9 signalosome complex subunit 2